MPMAISFVGAAVIFKLIYDARPEDVAQIGVLNAIYLHWAATRRSHGSRCRSGTTSS
jgi:ABC-type sugar transport system permease subunit